MSNLWPAVVSWAVSSRGIARLFGRLIERPIEQKHVHPRLAEDMEIAIVGMLGDERGNFFEREAAGFRNARGLELCVGHTDVRVEAAAGGRDGVGGDGRVGGEAVGRAVSSDGGLNAVGEFLARWAEVSAAGAGRIVTGARGGWARLEIFVAGETLREQRGAADGAVLVGDERAVGLGGKQRLRPGPDDERIRAAEQDGKDEREEECGFEFGEESFHGAKKFQTRWAALTRRSMALMPMNGITMPPKP